MHGALAWFVRNPVAANVLMVAVVLVGAFTVSDLRQEVVPTIQQDMVSVAVRYPGASPEEVEEAICMRIEEAVQGLSGVERITAQANENFGTVSIEYLESTDPQRFLDDVKSEIDRIDTFPDEAEEPTVNLVEINQQVLEVAVWGGEDLKGLRRLAEEVRAGLQQQPAITQVELSNAPPFEIAIEVSEQTLRAYGLSFDEVARAIRTASLDLPGGSLRTRGGEILVRSKGQAYDSFDFAALPLRTEADGTRLLLGDIARIVDDFEETDQASRFNGAPAVMMRVYRVGEQNALELAAQARAYVEAKQAELPEGLHLDIFADESRWLKERTGLMLKNGQQGLLLVLLALSLFLRLRLAAWVTVGIPIALLGSAALMPSLGVSINLISLMAFITVLGIVVDDAIVVAENIHRHRQMGKDGETAAVEGTQEVSVPVVFAVLTTMVAFLPMLFMPGSMGQFSRNIPLIVIACLIFSLVESLLILPSHLRHLPRENGKTKKGIWARVQDGVNRLLELFIDRVYAPSLRIATEWRYATLALALTILVLTGAYASSGRIKFNFFPAIEADNVAVELTMPLGTPLAVTEEAITGFEEAARQLQAELLNESGKPLITNIATATGGQPYREKQSSSTGGVTERFAGAHLAEVNLELLSAEERALSSTEIALLWQERAGTVPGAEEVVFNSDLLGGGGDIDLRLSGPDLEQLRLAAEDLRGALLEIGGVLSAQDSYREGKREWKLAITPQGEALGLSLADLARQVRQALYGEEVQSIQRGRDEVDVMLRYPAADRARLASLEDMRIRTAEGSELPFLEVARIERGRGFSTVDRTDRQRSLRVTADIDPQLTTPDQVTDALLAGPMQEILARYPGLEYGFEGRQKEQGDFMGRLIKLNLLALLAIYTLLAIPLRSYLQPLIIMMAIPFGLVGAVWGHALLGVDLAIMSVIGIAALGGVVINDSLVMIDFVNRLRSQGTSLHDAVMQAGGRRFRPILLTTVTTFLGLTPLLLERSLQAQFLIPMAISLAYGVLFATFITLILVPSTYLILEDLQRLPGWLARGLGWIRSRPRPTSS
ncbi:MAG: acriflavin resistance protein [Planctomycetes bacterium]|nr:acriflavin resistance protein [Planctomycetota bacterium]